MSVIGSDIQRLHPKGRNAVKHGKAVECLWVAVSILSVEIGSPVYARPPVLW